MTGRGYLSSRACRDQMVNGRAVVAAFMILSPLIGLACGFLFMALSSG